MRKIPSFVDALECVAIGLKTLQEQVVFVGGATTFAYMDSAVALEVRPTEDVDCAVEITSILQFEEMKAQLRLLGFKEDSSPGSPTCRWNFSGFTVDIMPTDERLLGFSNSWYPEGIQNKVPFLLPNGERIFIFSVPYFLATKLEAYHGRGNDDPRTSPDMEDILLVLDGCTDLLSNIQLSSSKAKDYLGREFSLLVLDQIFNEAIDGLFEREGGARIKKVRGIATQLAALKGR